MRIVHDLAVFAGEQFGQFLLVGFDQPFEFEHHPRAALRIGRRPFGLDLLGGGDRAVEQGGIAQWNLGLDFARRGVPDLVGAGRGSARSADDEMVKLTHESSSLFFATAHTRARSESNRYRVKPLPRAASRPPPSSARTGSRHRSPAHSPAQPATRRPGPVRGGRPPPPPGPMPRRRYSPCCLPRRRRTAP